MATIKGLLLRGNVYWFEYQVAGKRTRISLQTKDLNEAIDRASEIRGSALAGAPETIAALAEVHRLDPVSLFHVGKEFDASEIIDGIFPVKSEREGLDGGNKFHRFSLRVFHRSCSCRRKV